MPSLLGWRPSLYYVEGHHYIRLEAIATLGWWQAGGHRAIRPEAIAIRLEAIAIRLDAIAIRLEAIAVLQFFGHTLPVGALLAPRFTCSP